MTAETNQLTVEMQLDETGSVNPGFLDTAGNV